MKSQPPTPLGQPLTTSMGEVEPAVAADAGDVAEVAVPLPLHHTLHYRVPAALRAVALPGSRVRVRVGRRRLVGIVVAVHDRPPEGIELRDVDEMLDLHPVLPAELLRLGSFVAEYYMAPIGETLRGLVPSRLPSWGATRVRLTRRGAFLESATELEREVVDALLTTGETTLADLRARVRGDGFAAALDALERGGFVALSGGERRPSGERGSGGSGARYRAAVELPAGELETQLAAAGRSVQGRAVVEYLAALGRPATVTELTSALGSGAGVIRRLVQRGVLRTFTQIERLSLDRHLLSTQPSPVRELVAEQSAALESIEAAIASGGYRAFLLHGVTGSGKTEVYLRAVERALAAGRSAILLVPEISMVPALAAEARRRFGERLAILHSALGEGERAQEWERARSGRAQVVLGPRSAVLAPVERLGIVVVDEEHDAAFKQEKAPRYHARDVALLRARDAGAVAVLVSATPSFESRRNAATGKLVACRLGQRVGGGRLPDGILVDLRDEKGAARKPGEVHLSARLLEEMRSALDGGEQVILLRNRRGYAPVLLCRACGDKLACDDCGLPRTLHRRDRRLVCHYCGSARPIPATCPRCGAAAHEPIGAGTERVEERVVEIFPGVGVDVLDRDAARRIGGAAAVLERFAAGSTRILVGTQMVAKGHHFPNVGLTAVLAADSYLGFPDFRAVERTYSMLTQLAGRAGRGGRPGRESPGRVVIQTYFPDHYAIRAALAHDDEAFAAEEMRFRRVFHYPPFTRLVQLVVRGRDRALTERRSVELSTRLLAHPLAAGTRLSGPAPAPLERLQGQWRYQLLLRHVSGSRLRRLVAETVPQGDRDDVVVDVDPQDLF
ncbi:MAG TPA: primosomal protein N' [Thermoanaerobaculia bacterium]|nr:primosomal protein N' [Thermoanaerobaculia bacterium]